MNDNIKNPKIFEFEFFLIYFNLFYLLAKVEV